MLSTIKAILKNNDYVLYTDPFRLNIVGLRSKNTVANRFDDEIHIFYKNENMKWEYYVFPCTTDPGTYWLNNPAYEEGTASLPQGQYVDTYAIGMHRGKYEALVQVKALTVIRDYDRDAYLDFNNGTRQTGLFGINIHRAESTGTTKYVDKYSAGCQVFQNAEDFSTFMKLANQHRQRYGNLFTYTLLDFRAVRRTVYRRLVAVTTIVASAVLGWVIKEMYEL
jgi:hypothetical protein